jgi:ferric-dicitrate binding protein FerR (iron transport regulator)
MRRMGRVGALVVGMVHALWFGRKGKPLREPRRQQQTAIGDQQVAHKPAQRVALDRFG